MNRRPVMRSLRLLPHLLPARARRIGMKAGLNFLAFHAAATEELIRVTQETR